ncbi:MAG: GNAT family N-acetyltransferase, partial [Candidatus Zixiibacteriota bacterium]
MFVFTDDKKRLLEFFGKDPVLFAYHIGDLDDFYFPDCQWAVSYGYLPYIQEAVLVYYGGATPAVLAFGVSEQFPRLLEETLGILPSKFYCHYQSKSLDILRSGFSEQPLGTHWKMKLERFSPATMDKRFDDIVKLGPAHERELTELYQRAYPGNYFTKRMLLTGKYVGTSRNNRIVAVAGVHVCSDEYEIAVLGNITTDPDYRGQGLATRLTSHLTDLLAREGKLV